MTLNRFNALRRLRSTVPGVISSQSVLAMYRLWISLAVIATICVTTASATSGGILAACIDDSDCMKIGQGREYACFLYICYPWKDDSGVAAGEKRDLCRRSSDCRKPGQECQRHQDRRKINKGLCMNEVSTLDTI